MLLAFQTFEVEIPTSLKYYTFYADKLNKI